MRHRGKIKGKQREGKGEHDREIQAQYFDSMVDFFDQPQPPHVEENLRRIVESARIQPEDIILDVGAGVGVLTPFIRAFRPSKILACDISGRMLARLLGKNPDVEVHLEDIAQLNLQSESIDVIFMNAVFSNIEEKQKALENCFRMTKAGGRIVISHPEGRAFVDRLRAILPFPIDPMPLFPELRTFLAKLPVVITNYEDKSNLYLAVLEKVPQKKRRLRS